MVARCSLLLFLITINLLTRHGGGLPYGTEGGFNQARRGASIWHGGGLMASICSFLREMFLREMFLREMFLREKNRKV